jgi:hypothetical protein
VAAVVLETPVTDLEAAVQGVEVAEAGMQRHLGMVSTAPEVAVVVQVVQRPTTRAVTAAPASLSCATAHCPKPQRLRQSVPGMVLQMSRSPLRITPVALQ